MKTDLQYFVEIQDDDQDQESVGDDLDEATKFLSPSTPVTTATTATLDTSSTVTLSNSGRWVRNRNELMLFEVNLALKCSLPYRMKIYTEFNLATWLILVE